MLLFKNPRKPNRLKEYNYSRVGYYYVTICVKNREKLLGNIVGDKVYLNNLGKIIKNVWVNLPQYYLNIQLDYWVIMPNHLHGIIIINNTSAVGTGFKPVPTQHCSLSEVIRGFKTFSSKQINQLGNDLIFHWQRSFYDHIIRNDYDLNRIREYIKNNPLN